MSGIPINIKVDANPLFMPTMNLRAVKLEPGMYQLQQMWQGSDGTQEWRSIPRILPNGEPEE